MKKKYLFLFALTVSFVPCIAASASQAQKDQEYIAHAHRSGRFEAEAQRQGEFEFHVKAHPDILHEFYPSIGYIAPHQALRNDPKFKELVAQEKARFWEKHTRWLDSQERVELEKERHHLLGRYL